MQLRSRAEHTRETLHPSYHSGGTERGSELPQMHSNVLAKEGLVSRNEGIQEKKKIGWRILEEKDQETRGRRGGKSTERGCCCLVRKSCPTLLRCYGL